MKHDKDVNGLLLPEHSSCWGCSGTDLQLWIWWWIVGELWAAFVHEQCSAGRLNGKGTGILLFLISSHWMYLFWPIGSAATAQRVWKWAVLNHTLVPWQYSLCLIMWYKIIHQKGLNVLFTQSLCSNNLLNNDSSLYLQRQRKLPLFASGNFLPKASTGGGGCFYST